MSDQMAIATDNLFVPTPALPQLLVGRCKIPADLRI